MQTRDADPNSSFTSKMIANTLLQFFLDGYDTLGSVLTMAIYYLTINPDVQEKLYQEIEEVTSNIKSDSLEFDDLKEFDYLDRYIEISIVLIDNLGFFDFLLLIGFLGVKSLHFIT